MDVIMTRLLKDFADEFPDAACPISEWIDAVKDEMWTCFGDARRKFGSVSIYRECLIFNIAGNKYRLVCGVRYANVGKSGRPTRAILFVKAIMTHKDYDEDRWKCLCE